MPTRALTIRQRRFIRHYVATGNATQAALAVYNTRNPNSAHALAAETLRSPTVQAAVAELLDAEGISDKKLHRIHAHLLALYTSPDPREKAIACRALHMAYQLTGAYEPEARDPDRVFDGWTTDELVYFASTGEWPARFQAENRAAPVTGISPSSTRR